jgi:hypothetical protein
VREQFDPIVLKYDGLEAGQNIIELGQLGQSIQGAARLLGSAGTLVETGQFVKKEAALSVRVVAGTPRPGSYELVVFIVSLTPIVTPWFPTLQDFGKTLATKAVTSIVNYGIAKLGGRKSEAQMAFDLAEKAITEMGHTSRTAIESIERVAISQRPAIKLFVAPVGKSCATAQVGDQTNGAIAVDKATRDAIEAPVPIDVGPTAKFEILLSELDLKNKSCKFSMRDDDDPDHRTNGEITDPILLTPNNAYAAALDSQKWISVTGKPYLKDGEIDRLYISDIVK